MGDWQPIETAPRGERLLLFGSTRHDNAVIFSGYKARNCTLYADHGEWCNPTHWMPLPAPPATEQMTDNPAKAGA